MTIGIVTNNPSRNSQALFSVPTLWTVRVLAWLAFIIASYLAYASLGHEVSLGCTNGGADCAEVQSSVWSVWLGLPVAIAGLACYSALAALSVLTVVSNPRVSPWVYTLLILFSLAAALSGVWFTGLQLFALKKFCLWCMGLHLCGISIAALVLWSVFKDFQARPQITAAHSGSASMTALRAAIPGVPGAAAAPAVVRAAPAPNFGPRPSLSIAFGGALALLVALVGGQLLFPPAGPKQETVQLTNSIHLSGTPDPNSDKTGDAQPYVAQKIATELPTSDAGVKTATHAEPETTGSKSPGNNSAAGNSGKIADAGAKEDTGPPKKRIVTFLGGKLSLDVYRFPVLGSPEAPNIVVEFVSYDCKHCRSTHRMVHRALERYGDQVAVVILMFPAGIECNKQVTSADKSVTGACDTARMALAVATIEPERFAKFHDWLMENGEKPPAVAQVVQKAYNTVGRDRIVKLSQDEFKKQINQYVDLFNNIAVMRGADAQKQGLPLIIVGDQVLSGEPANEEQFIQSWGATLGIQPSGAAPKLQL